MQGSKYVIVSSIVQEMTTGSAVTVLIGAPRRVGIQVHDIQSYISVPTKLDGTDIL